VKVIKQYVMIVLWFLLLFSGNHAQNTTDTPSQQTQNQESTPVKPLVVEQQRSAPDYYQISCERPNDHDAADLCEQRRMAQAAEDSVYWARVQALIGFFGFVGVLITLVFTGQGTRAASRQVHLSRHALISTDRAFLFPKGCVLQASTSVESKQIQHWLIYMQWENTGKTPPRYVRTQSVRTILPSRLPNDFDFSSFYVVADIQLLIPPGNIIQSDRFIITLEQMDDIIAGKQHLYFFGWIEYDDVFEGTPRHRTEFCHYMTGSGNPRNQETFSYRFSFHRKHNGADEECDYPLKTTSRKDTGNR
jgi:hypothetical protein